MFWRLHHFLGRDEWFWYLTPKKRRHDELLKRMSSFTRQVIQERRQAKTDSNTEQPDDDVGIKKRRALLDILLESTIDGKYLSDNDIQEEVDNFMFAGHDTTASAITFLLYNLAKYPEIQQKVFEEVVSVLGADQSLPISLSKLNDLDYMELVIKESLRLFPSVPMIGRTTKEDIVVSKFT